MEEAKVDHLVAQMDWWKVVERVDLKGAVKVVQKAALWADKKVGK